MEEEDKGDASSKEDDEGSDTDSPKGIKEEVDNTRLMTPKMKNLMKQQDATCMLKNEV